MGIPLETQRCMGGYTVKPLQRFLYTHPPPCFQWYTRQWCVSQKWQYLRGDLRNCVELDSTIETPMRRLKKNKKKQRLAARTNSFVTQTLHFQIFNCNRIFSRLRVVEVNHFVVAQVTCYARLVDIRSNTQDASWHLHSATNGPWTSHR